ncbi:MAG: hypothetical protein HFG53_07955 [Lachnospiraceae bacterium]|jgi:hypothetical protein|nr:hypothetical protein [Lachnospiraceae bacterium]
MNWGKAIALGIGAVVVAAFLMWNPFRGFKRYEQRFVEVQVVKKEIMNIEGEDVYLLHCLKQDGQEEIFEIANEAIGERFEESIVYKQIKAKKYYNFRVADREQFNSYYPCVCGAVTLIEGFTDAH